MNPTQQLECSICFEDGFRKIQIVKCPHCDLHFCKKCFHDQLLELKTPEISICICGNAYSLYQVLDLVGSTWFQLTFSKHYKKVLLSYQESQAQVYQSSRLFQLYQQKSKLELEIRTAEIPWKIAERRFCSWNDQRKVVTLELEKKKIAAQKELAALSDPSEVQACKAKLKEINDELLHNKFDYLRGREKQELEKNDLELQLNEICSKMGSLNHRIKRLEQNPQLTQEEETIFTDHYNCPHPKCTDLVISKDGICGKCSAPTCLECRELLEVDSKEEGEQKEHECNPQILKNLKALKFDQATKPCPRCRVPIHKFAGCNDVFCTKCHLKFNFRTGEEIRGAFHNPEYNRFLAQRQNEDDDCHAQLGHYIQLAPKPLGEILRILDAFVPEVTEIRNQLLAEINLSHHQIKEYFRYTNNELTKQGYTNKLINRARKREFNSRAVDYLNTAIVIGDYFRFKVLDFIETEIQPNLRLVVDNKISQYQQELLNYFGDFCREIRQLNTYLYSLGRLTKRGVILNFGLVEFRRRDQGVWSLLAVPYARQTKFNLSSEDNLPTRAALFNHWNKIVGPSTRKNFYDAVQFERYRSFSSFCSQNVLSSMEHVFDAGMATYAQMVIKGETSSIRFADFAKNLLLLTRDQDQERVSYEFQLHERKANPLINYYIEHQQI